LKYLESIESKVLLSKEEEEERKKRKEKENGKQTDNEE
jgi:hypothetical protein